MEYNEIEYFARKKYWLEIFRSLKPRNETNEEIDAFENARENYLGNAWANADET